MKKNYNLTLSQKNSNSFSFENTDQIAMNKSLLRTVLTVIALLLIASLSVANEQFSPETGELTYNAALTGDINSASATGSKTMVDPGPQYWNAIPIASANNFPFNVNATFGKRVQWIVAPGEFGSPSAAPSANITDLWFRPNSACNVTYTNFTVRMANVPTTTFFSYGQFYTGSMTTVLSANTTIASAALTWTKIPLTTSFSYDNTMNLIIEVSQCGYTGTGFTIYQQQYGAAPDYRRQYSDGSSPCGSVSLPSGGDCSVPAIGIDVSTACAITLSSATGTDVQSVCINTPITNITYNTTIATGATVSGMPEGVTVNGPPN